MPGSLQGGRARGGHASRGRGIGLAGTSLVALALAAAAPAAAREKTDVVVLLNGDRLTGEIMGMSRGKLDLKTDDAGRPSIEWLKVARVESVHAFEIETVDRVKRYGPLRPPADGSGALQLDDGTSIPVPDVISIVPLDAGLLARLSSYLDLGFSFARANKAWTLSGDAFVGYRGERLGTTLELAAYLQDSEAAAAVANASATLVGDAYFGPWTAQASVRAEHNQALDLDLRLTLAGAAAYSLVRSNSTDLSARAGLAGMREQYATGDPTWYVTAYLAASWEAFRYDSPKLDAGISVTAYPYLNDLGRVRVDTVLRVKYEVLADFNLGLNLSDTYDSRPPEAGAHNDYYLTLTVGWSYRR